MGVELAIPWSAVEYFTTEPIPSLVMCNKKHKCPHNPTTMRNFRNFEHSTPFSKVESELRCHYDGHMKLSLASDEGGWGNTILAVLLSANV